LYDLSRCREPRVLASGAIVGHAVVGDAVAVLVEAVTDLDRAGKHAGVGIVAVYRFGGAVPVGVYRRGGVRIAGGAVGAVV
jgi:hypothetical protein